MSAYLWRLTDEHAVFYTDDRALLTAALAYPRFPHQDLSRATTYHGKNNRVFAWQFTFPLEAWNGLVRCLGRAALTFLDDAPGARATVSGAKAAKTPAPENTQAAAVKKPARASIPPAPTAPARKTGDAPPVKAKTAAAKPEKTAASRPSETRSAQPAIETRPAPRNTDPKGAGVIQPTPTKAKASAPIRGKAGKPDAPTPVRKQTAASAQAIGPESTPATATSLSAKQRKADGAAQPAAPRRIPEAASLQSSAAVPKRKAPAAVAAPPPEAKAVKAERTVSLAPAAPVIGKPKRPDSSPPANTAAKQTRAKASATMPEPAALAAKTRAAKASRPATAPAAPPPPRATPEPEAKLRRAAGRGKKAEAVAMDLSLPSAVEAAVRAKQPGATKTRSAPVKELQLSLAEVGGPPSKPRPSSGSRRTRQG